MLFQEEEFQGTLETIDLTVEFVGKVVHNSSYTHDHNAAVLHKPSPPRRKLLIMFSMSLFSGHGHFPSLQLLYLCLSMPRFDVDRRAHAREMEEPGLDMALLYLVDFPHDDHTQRLDLP